VPFSLSLSLSLSSPLIEIFFLYVRGKVKARGVRYRYISQRIYRSHWRGRTRSGHSRRFFFNPNHSVTTRDREVKYKSSGKGAKKNRSWRWISDRPLALSRSRCIDTIERSGSDIYAIACIFPLTQIFVRVGGGARWLYLSISGLSDR